MGFWFFMLSMGLVIPMRFLSGRVVQTVGWTGSAVMAAKMIALVSSVLLMERALKRQFDES